MEMPGLRFSVVNSTMCRARQPVRTKIGNEKQRRGKNEIFSSHQMNLLTSVSILIFPFFPFQEEKFHERIKRI